MDLLAAVLPDPVVQPAFRRQSRVAACLLGDGAGFRTRPVERLTLDLAGAVGDGHAGFTRRAGGREPWYPRGTEIRSGRQISIVSVEELAEVATSLGVAEVDAGLIGANLVIAGLSRLSFLPAGTRLVFEGGAALVVEGMNAPCRQASRALAAAHPGRGDLELGFVSAARHRRGVVASVERAGEVAAGADLEARIPAQWIYEG